MDKLPMQTLNLAERNFAAIDALFPNAVTETVDDTGAVVRAIDADILAQEINTRVVSGKEERYQFTWPDKKKSVLQRDEKGEYSLDRLDKQSIRYSPSLDYEIIVPNGERYTPKHKAPANPNAT